jgi:hypothetical protein
MYKGCGPSTTSSDYDELRKIAKNAKGYVLKCPNVGCKDNGDTKNASRWCRNDEYSWMIDMLCTNCNSQWSLCCECHNVKTALTTDNQIKQHRYTYHNPNKPNKRKQPIANIKKPPLRKNTADDHCSVSNEMSYVMITRTPFH